MKKVAFYFGLLSFMFFIIHPVYSQLFTWMSGSDISSQNGNYGTMGQPAAANTPGARELSMGWTSKDGDLWLFGGNGYPVSGATGRLNDLWKYDVEEGGWIWVKGPNVINQSGNYGTKGVPAGSNSPGGRNQSVTWTDTSGNLWLFGGSGYDASGNIGMLNDLWKYDISTEQWTWMHGGNSVDAFGTYGAIGTPNTTNTPGGRRVAVGWVDNANNLWLFSGDGFGASGSQGYLNDLWKYNITTNQWTWVKGANVVNELGTYGTIGIANPANVPGARYAAASWQDQSGNFWVFNGNGFPATGSSGRLNDLWKYDPLSNQWTWVKGSNQINLMGSYGTQGTGVGSNTPGCRYVSNVFGNGSDVLWMFGGLGYATTTTQGRLNDLWRYNSATNIWTWMKGSNTTNLNGVYGSQHVTSTSNVIGARNGAVTWTDNYGRMWIFGGSGFSSTGGSSYLNDLWRINCTTAPQKFTDNVTICNGEDASMEVFGPGTFSWYTAPVGGMHLGDGNTMTIPGLTMNAVYYVMDSGCGNNGPRSAVMVTVLDSVDVTVSVTNNLLTATNPSATAYQWLDCNNGMTKISGAIGKNFTPPNGGSYAVIVSQGSCSDTSECVLLTVGLDEGGRDEGIQVYPNPSTHHVFIECPSNGQIEIFDSKGSLLNTFERQVIDDHTVRISGLPKGLHMMRIVVEDEISLHRILVLEY